MLLLFRFPLHLLIATNWNASNRNLQSSVLIVSSPSPLRLSLWFRAFKVRTLPKTGYPLDALSLIQVYLGSKFCPPFRKLLGEFPLYVQWAALKVTRRSGNNSLPSFIRHGPHRKQRVQQFYYCCAYIRCRSNVFTKLLPSSDREIII
jgi:hypothetical protein